MDTDTLLRLKLEMEFGAPVDGHTLTPATTNADGQPRLIVSRHAGGFSRFYRHDLPVGTRAAVAQLAAERAFEDEQVITQLLETDAPVEHIWRVRWHVIQVAPPPSAFPDVTRAADGHVIVRDGAVVARAWTTADSPVATEVEVETHPDYRRRGYARQVVAAWAAAALAAGKVAYYSHVMANDASRGVARSLGLTWLSDEVEYE